MSGLTKQIIDGVIKKFEVLEGYFTKDKYNIDRITDVSDLEVDDMSFLHTMHDYLITQWKYTSPIETYMDRKKNLRMSNNGNAFNKGMEVLKGELEEQEKKNNWDKLMGVG